MLKRWEQLPQELQNDSVRPYYEALSRKRGQLLLKRVFDILLSLVLLVLLSPVMLILALAIRLDSPGEVLFRQVRVTQYGQEFRIFKFRTMVANAQQLGKLLRKCRLDELPQLLNILMGQMSFVGTRPEVPCYVRQYTPQMLATLLLPAGVTSQASIRYKDEDRLLDSSSDPDRTYVEQVLPGKMEYNLNSLLDFSLWQDLKTMVQTVGAVLH